MIHLCQEIFKTLESSGHFNFSTLLQSPLRKKRNQETTPSTITKKPKHMSLEEELAMTKEKLGAAIKENEELKSKLHGALTSQGIRKARDELSAAELSNIDDEGDIDPSVVAIWGGGGGGCGTTS